MGYFIFRRSIQSLFSLVALVILVFFLSRLTGSPADLYLPQDATEECASSSTCSTASTSRCMCSSGRF